MEIVKVTTHRGMTRHLTERETFWLNIFKDGIFSQLQSIGGKGAFYWSKNPYIGTRNEHQIKIGNKAGVITIYGYIAIRFKGNHIFGHQLSFLLKYGYIPPIIDHKDHIRDNNYWENLEDVTISENGQNRSKPPKNSESGIIGVVQLKDRKTGNYIQKWQSQIKINGRQIWLGEFTDKNLAIIARHQAELKYFTHAPSSRVLISIQ